MHDHLHLLIVADSTATAWHCQYSGKSTVPTDSHGRWQFDADWAKCANRDSGSDLEDL